MSWKHFLLNLVDGSARAVGNGLRGLSHFVVGLGVDIANVIAGVRIAGVAVLTAIGGLGVYAYANPKVVMPERCRLLGHEAGAIKVLSDERSCQRGRVVAVQARVSDDEGGTGGGARVFIMAAAVYPGLDVVRSTEENWIERPVGGPPKREAAGTIEQDWVRGRYFWRSDLSQTCGRGSSAGFILRSGPRRIGANCEGQLQDEAARRRCRPATVEIFVPADEAQWCLSRDRFDYGTRVVEPRQSASICIRRIFEADPRAKVPEPPPVWQPLGEVRKVWCD
jgi:hypothetical protein